MPKYFDAIPFEPFQSALKSLIHLGLINYDDTISQIGLIVESFWTVEVELALLVLAGAVFDVYEYCVMLAAILSVSGQGSSMRI